MNCAFKKTFFHRIAPLAAFPKSKEKIVKDFIQYLFLIFTGHESNTLQMTLVHGMLHSFFITFNCRLVISLYRSINLQGSIANNYHIICCTLLCGF